MNDKHQATAFGSETRPKRHFAKNLRFSLLAAFAACATSNADQTWFVAAATGSDDNDGLTAETAFASIQKAIDSSDWGDRILVDDGVYGAIVTTNQLLTIESVGGAGRTVIDGNGETRAANFGEGFGADIVTNTMLRGFTVRNGYASYGGGGIIFGTAEACIIENNAAEVGAGSWGGVRIDCIIRNNQASGEGGAMYYGTAIRCIMSDNYADYYAGAMSYGTANHCTFAGNEAAYGGALSDTVANACVISNNYAYLGAGSFYATCSNCLFVANTVFGGGGAGYYGTYDHCTFVGNHAEAGGALYRGKASNCIFDGNTSDYNDSGKDTLGTDVSYSMASDIVDNSGSGTGVVSGDPKFVSPTTGDYRLSPDSPCINAGDPAFPFGGEDLDGNPRVRNGRTDMGAFEGLLAGSSGVFAETPSGGGLTPLGNFVLSPGESMNFRAYGPRPFLGFFTNGVFASASSPLTLAASGGDIVVEARFDLTSSITIYADASQTGPADGKTWETAFAWLQDAIDMAVDGDLISVAPGTYLPISSGNKNIEIRSTEGAGSTIIDGSGSARCASLGSRSGENATRLFGFTLQNGEANYGGGAMGGTLVDCAIRGNHAGNGGGGAYRSILENCTVSGNSARTGGGLNASYAYGCVIDENTAESGWGGGAEDCHLEDCVVENNTASRNGGGIDMGTAVRCTIRNNSASGSGGGAAVATLENCLVIGNRAAVFGGGAFGTYNDDTANLINCTVSGNVAGTAGGGVCAQVTADCRDASGSEVLCYAVSLNNSIVWGNSLSSGIADNVATVDSSGTLSDNPGSGILSASTLSEPVLAGNGNIGGNPGFASARDGDFSLAADSPCIDAGSRLYQTVRISVDSQSRYTCFIESGSVHSSARDLAGNPRFLFAGIDLGCLERTIAVPRERTFAEIWGTWSSESIPALAVSRSADSWMQLAMTAWNLRDAFVRNGIRTEVPPGTDPVVLSLGALMTTGELIGLGGAEIPQDVEYGVPVWRLRMREIEETAGAGNVSRRMEFSVGGVEIQYPLSLPSYPSEEWVADVYGNPPQWLSQEERNDWFARRSRARVEWFVTLVAPEYWAQYENARMEDAFDAFTEEEGFNAVSFSGIRPGSGGPGYHHVFVRVASDNAQVRLFGTDDLPSERWEYKGLSLQDGGSAAVGAIAEGNSAFFSASRSVGSSRDSDGDGIPDAIETKVLGTNPHRADTSGDGLSDWEKFYRLDLDPTVRDTAGDGISDTEKIAAGIDPRIPASPAQATAASRSIRYTYDDDDRLTGTWFGLGGASTTTDLSPAGNPNDIRDRDADR